MARTVRLPDIDDVTKASEFVEFLNLQRKLANFLGYQAAITAAATKAMLREHDKRSKEGRRAHKVARPIALIAGIYVGIAKLWAMSAKRFELLYAAEIEMYKTKKRTARTMDFEG